MLQSAVFQYGEDDVMMMSYISVVMALSNTENYCAKNCTPYVKF